MEQLSLIIDRHATTSGLAAALHQAGYILSAATLTTPHGRPYRYRRAITRHTDKRDIRQFLYSFAKKPPGREEVSGVDDQKKPSTSSRTLKAGSKTYFFDIAKTKNGKRYLKISESQFKGEGAKRERSTIFVFPESAQEFGQVVSEMVAKVSQNKQAA